MQGKKDKHHLLRLASSPLSAHTPPPPTSPAILPDYSNATPISPNPAAYVTTTAESPAAVSPMAGRAKRSSSRMTESANSRLSDDDLKTAVKVAVRVRPPLVPTDPGFDLIPQRFRESTCDVPTSTSLQVQSTQGKKLFVFDRVFDETTTQDGIWDYLSESVTSFVQGYNVSILAYGQSGAGKSYTMGTSGPEEQSDSQVMGVVPRAAQALFEKLNGSGAAGGSMRQSGIQTPKRYSTHTLPTLNNLAKQANADKNWTLKATYVEIYNENLRDLLVDESVPEADRASVSIREDTKGRILLTGLTQVDINSADDMLHALNFGSTIRQTDATAINARSSRSHAVFSLNLVQKKTETAGGTPKRDKRVSAPLEPMSPGENVVTIDSKLNFVDLAGSERLKNTGATGDRAKEGISINAGLASLGKVISQLSSKGGQKHISYRDSRLTRLLQDSLGGNAITFMMACVTPAAFHLNETLNTVTYAQRARAIQSRPEIQQSHDEGDKQAVIDRLKAEVQFLRDQISHSDRSDSKDTVLGAKANRFREQDAELQTQLMDIQENYNALSARHAKLISEISKARDNSESDTPMLKEAVGETAMDRLKRSNSFAEAVEQVVLEYEKTIQSLESTLSKTRSSLSNTESTLMEKDTRIAYMETIQTQLQARLHKASEREQSNEDYLRDLESRMEGSSSGEERNMALVAELRKELSRAREGETGAEEYISTLEDRLAEAEQDQEIMQREIDRLEHVVERQRSIGRLDNLLSDLDSLRPNEQKDLASENSIPNGNRDSYDPYRPADRSDDTDAHSSNDFENSQAEQIAIEKHTSMGESDDAESQSTRAYKDASYNAAGTKDLQSPAQNDFMADKLENLTQELFDLRSEHETTVIDYDNLQQKYQTALKTLAQLEYDKESPPKSPQTPTQSRPASFLEDAGRREEEKAGPEATGEPSSSRSLSAELSSLAPSSITRGEEQLRKESEDSNLSPATEELDVVAEVDDVGKSSARESDARDEMELLRKLHAEKELSVAELTNNYKSLVDRHQATLEQVEDLRIEVQRAQFARASPTSPSFGKALLRRKSDDLLGMHASDRAHRLMASIRNIALDHFQDQPDARQGFEHNLDAVMHELHGRSERVQSLEAELGTVRKDLEAKQRVISGLTRERSSWQTSSGVDFSVVGQMRDQLMESEQQIRTLHEAHASREKEFQDQVDILKASLEEHRNSAGKQSSENPTFDDGISPHMPGDFPETPGLDVTPTSELGHEQVTAGASRSDEESDIAQLQRELAAWETKHHSAMDSMKASEARLLATISDLEAAMRNAESGSKDRDGETKTGDRMQTSEAVDASFGIEQERAKHQEVIDALQRELADYKTTAASHVSKLDELEQSYAKIVSQVDEDSKAHDLTHRELQTHRDLAANLESQLQVHHTTVQTHQQSLVSLQASHAKELEELQMHMRNVENDSRNGQAELESRHSDALKQMEANLTRLQSEHSDLLRNASTGLGFETDAVMLKDHIQGLKDEGKELHARHLQAAAELNGVSEELQNALNKNVDLEEKIAELKTINEGALADLKKISEREKKSSRLVEELEDQLNTNFDSHQAANNRLSAMQTERQVHLEEAVKELEEQKAKNQVLEQQLASGKHQSVTSDRGSVIFNRESLSPEAAAIALARSPSQTSALRKSGPTTALPTPPPSIPLPPLPNNQNMHDPRASSTSSPPPSRHASHDVTSTHLSQLIEEQETRIRTIEKHLFAEKQLTATLEEALVDLETSANRTKSEMDGWRKKCSALEDELVGLRKQRSESRASLQAVEEEREMRVRAERARQALEQRMAELNSSKKKKKGGLNCF
ncbi:hypothetical protein MBLNU230_g1802t1 [Neophaeotheca triangularis]